MELVCVVWFTLRTASPRQKVVILNRKEGYTKNHKEGGIT